MTSDSEVEKVVILLGRTDSLYECIVVLLKLVDLQLVSVATGSMLARCLGWKIRVTTCVMYRSPRVGEVSVSYLLWEPEIPFGVPVSPRRLLSGNPTLGVGPPIDHDRRLPSKTAP